MIPVVLIHKGNSSYIYNTLYQLKQTNPSVTIYLIGTRESVVYKPFVEHIFIDTLFEEAQEFSNIYKHFSTNSAAFELICIQRWFVLKAFMSQKNIQRCLYLDSDVLVYADIEKLSEKYNSAGMTLCGISGHTNFVERDTLIDFCAFVFASYTGHDALTSLQNHYDLFIAKHNAGGVSDMTLLTNYAEKNPGKVINTYCFTGLPTFDPSMEVGAEYFEMNNYTKKITFQDGKPFGTLKIKQQPVLFYTLHFQGAKSKKDMRQYIPFKSFFFWLQHTKYTGIYYWQKIKKKVL